MGKTLSKSHSKAGWCLGRTSWPAAEALHRQPHITEVAAVQGLVLKAQKLDPIRDPELLGLGKLTHSEETGGG